MKKKVNDSFYSYAGCDACGTNNSLRWRFHKTSNETIARVCSCRQCNAIVSIKEEEEVEVQNFQYPKGD